MILRELLIVSYCWSSGEATSLQVGDPRVTCILRWWSLQQEMRPSPSKQLCILHFALFTRVKWSRAITISLVDTSVVSASHCSASGLVLCDIFYSKTLLTPSIFHHIDKILVTCDLILPIIDSIVWNKNLFYRNHSYHPNVLCSEGQGCKLFIISSYQPVRSIQYRVTKTLLACRFHYYLLTIHILGGILYLPIVYNVYC